MKTVLISLLLVFLACSSPQSKTAVDEKHPPLALHPDNSHYFLFRGKPAMLITSGEHYGAVLNLDFDYTRYLDELQAHGLNLTRTWVGSYREIPSSFGITGNTLAPLPGRYVCPWARSAEPGNFDGGAKFDLNRWDEIYFSRLRDFMTQASSRGVVVELNLFCPNYNDSLWLASPMHTGNNINSVGNCPADEPYTLKHPELQAVQEALVRKAVAELRDFDNLYYEVCNEPYFGGVTVEWQHRIADVIVEAERDFPRRHLISMNIANGRALVENPHPAVSIFNFHYCQPPDVVAQNWALNRVIGENETGFRGQADSTYRSEGWDFILAGGALYNNLDYSFSAGHPDGSLSGYVSPGGGSLELRKQLGILSRFVRSFDFVRMAPDSSVVAGGVPEGATTRTLAEPGRQYALYLHGGTQANLELALPAGSYVFEWLDTKTGVVVAGGNIEHAGGAAVLGSPQYETDIALGIRSR